MSVAEPVHRRPCPSVGPGMSRKLGPVNNAMEFRVTIDPSDETAVALLRQLAGRGDVAVPIHGPGTTLVIGGARSGKSFWAESQLVAHPDVEYVATSYYDPDDAEWVERIRLHRERRPAAWRTTETIDLPAVLAADDSAPVLVDCLAVWLDRVLFEADAWNDAEGWRAALKAQVDALVAAIRDTRRDVILVTNEVGLGIVPGTPGGRLYRDELGRLNVAVAAAVDEVWTCTAGIARRLK